MIPGMNLAVMNTGAMTGRGTAAVEEEEEAGDMVVAEIVMMMRRGGRRGVMMTGLVTKSRASSLLVSGCVHDDGKYLVPGFVCVYIELGVCSYVVFIPSSRP